MSLHLLQTKLKYGLMSKKDMEKLKEEYNSYPDSERYIIRSLLNNRMANFETKKAQMAYLEEKKGYKIGDKFRFAFNKTDAVLGLGAIATCAIAVGAATLGAPALVPAFAGATVILAATGIINETLCCLKARKGKYNMNKIVKLSRHPIKSLRMKLWNRKLARNQKIMDIISAAESNAEVAKTTVTQPEAAAKETPVEIPVVEQAKAPEAKKECCCEKGEAAACM